MTIEMHPALALMLAIVAAWMVLRLTDRQPSDES